MRQLSFTVRLLCPGLEKHKGSGVFQWDYEICSGKAGLSFRFMSLKAYPMPQHITAYYNTI